MRNCDNKGVCKKHLKQMPEFKYPLNTPKKLPENVLKMLPYELWLDIFEKIPKKQCAILSPINGIMTNGITKVNWHCRSCGKKYITTHPSSISRL